MKILLINCFIVRSDLSKKAGVIFLLGKPSEQQLSEVKDEDFLTKENRIFGDILQFDFQDSYPHLSHKVISAYLWTNRCGCVMIVDMF